MSSVYYPQAVATIRIRWEDFDSNDSLLSKTAKQSLIPRNVRVVLNDYTSADKFNMTIDYKDFPYDPRSIRALGVTIHVEDRKSLYKQDGTLNFIQPKEDNIVFQGFADEDNIEFSDSDRTVTFEGRDFTSLLIDAPYNGQALELNLKVDELISNIVKSIEATQKIKIVNKTGGTLPTLGKFAPDFNKLSTKRSAKKKESLWDVIQDLAARSGLIAYISLDELILTKPRQLFDKDKNYRFVHGRNIESLSFKRKIGRQKGLNIRVRSLNIEKKEVIEADIPREATSSWADSIGVKRENQTVEKIGSDGEVKKEVAPFLTFFLPNISNKDQLIEVGQNTWEEVGRQQLEGKLKTFDMATQQKDNNKTELLDLLKLRIGDAIKIEIDTDDLEGLQRFKKESDRSNYLISRGYTNEVARAFARTLGKFETRFYTKSVEFTVDLDSGFSQSIDFINFIETDQKALK